jgi:phage baseplate assembly protein W
LFKPRPSGDIYKKTDAAAVKQSVLNIIMTNFYEKPFRPFFGSNLREQLFELSDGSSTAAIKNTITTALSNYETRIKIKSIEVKPNPSNNEVSIKLVFNIINSTDDLVVQTYVSRLR